MSTTRSIFDYDLRDILTDAAKLGATAALAGAGLLKPYLSKAEAYRLYGRYKVDKWIRMQMVSVNQDLGNNDKGRIDRVEIEAVASSQNLATYINNQYFKSKGIKIDWDKARNPANKPPKK